MEADHLPFFSANAPMATQITARRLNQLVACIRANALKPGVGYDYSRNVGGTSLTVRAGGGGGSLPTICPFDLALTEVAGTYTGTFTPGTINGLLPSNYLALTDIDKTGTVYIKCDLTLTNATVQTAVFATSGTMPPAFPTSMGVPPTTLSILTHVIVRGTVFRVIGCGSLWVTPQQSFETDKTGVIAPGEKSTDLWYSYLLTIV